MKEEIIRNLLSGSLESFDCVKRTDEEEKLLDEIIVYDTKLREQLAFSLELSTLYNDTNDAVENYHCAREETYYTEGFKLGFRLCLELLRIES